jgi:dTDP-4-amino-4,6-dideoxygalactose transaminase
MTGVAITVKVNFSYLDRQFADVEPYLQDISCLVRRGDFTLGSALTEFERRFAAICGVSHAIGVGSGTDAITIPLKVSGVGPGDEVITCPTTFIATVGAIAMTGARPVFVDSEDGFVIDPSKIEAAITRRTKAIVPVHYTGNVADMPAILDIAARHGLLVVEDACQAIGAALNGKPAGSWGDAGSFSLHPLKNLNVWGDGGVIVTNSAELAERIRLFRNHGLVDRDHVAMFGCNSRLDTMQAVIGNRLIHEMEAITECRIAAAEYYDEAFGGLREFIKTPVRRFGVRHVFHLYMVRAQRRNQLLTYLNSNGVEAKIHYPIPVHLQAAASHLGYKQGAFPMSEEDSKSIITLPAHQHLSSKELQYTVDAVSSFYSSGSK